MTANLSNELPMEPKEFDRGNPDRRCTAHRKNGQQCRKWAILGGTVCATHGGAAPAVRRAAALRLAMAADRMAKNLLGLATEADTDSVKLAATNSALDRAGLAAKSNMSIELSAKPFERVFEKIVSGPRYPATPPALAASESSGEDDGAIVGEIDDDPLPEGGEDLSPVERESGYTDTDADVIDVEIMSDQSLADSPDDPDYPGSGAHSFTPGPLGPSGPAGSGLMTLSDAVEAAAAMRAREAARVRDMRRR